MSELGKTGHKCRFLIVTQPRSGSYHLASLLDSAPDVLCLGEIFKGNRVELPVWLRKKVGIARDDTWLRDIDREAYLAQLLSFCDKPVFGFKEFNTRIMQIGIGKVTLRSRHWQKIFLMRNPIRKYVSLHRARETGSYTKTATEALPEDNATIRFDPALFDETIRMDVMLRNIFQELKESRPRRVMAVDYRDLNNPRKLGRVLEFISSEAEATTLKSDYFRQNSLPLDQSIEDFDALVRHARAKGLQAELDDALRPDS